VARSCLEVLNYVWRTFLSFGHSCPGYISRPPGFKGVRIVSQDLGLAQQRIRWRIT
jgi:hypothetical protein